MKNALLSITIPFTFFLVLNLINLIVGYTFDITLGVIMQGTIIFSVIVTLVFTLAFYVNVFEHVNKV